MSNLAGRHKARGVAGSEVFGKSSTGNDQVQVSLALSETGQRVTTFLSFSEKAKPYSMERLYALGWQPGSEESLPGIDRNEVEIDIKYEMYNGKESMKVDIVTGGAGIPEENRFAPKEKKSFLQSLNRDAAPAFNHGASAAAAPAAKPSF